MSAEDSPNQPNVLRNAIPMDVLRGHERLIALPPIESVVCVSPVSFRYDLSFSNVMGAVRLARPQADRDASIHRRGWANQAAQSADTCDRSIPSLIHCIMVSCQAVQLLAQRACTKKLPVGSSPPGLHSWYATDLSRIAICKRCGTPTHYQPRHLDVPLPKIHGTRMTMSAARCCVLVEG